MAQGFWALLVPHGLKGGALAHKRDDGDDDTMGIDEEGWQEGHLDWWFEFLAGKGQRGISKDVWQMVRFVDTRCASCSGVLTLASSSWSLFAP